MNFKVSYECSELIEEIKEDIQEFGANTSAYAVWKKRLVKVPFLDKHTHVDILTDYLIGSEPPEDLVDGEVAVLSTLGEIVSVNIISQ